MKKESFSTFADQNFDILIFDEVQHLKNIRSLGANAARQIQAKFRICLTGTPVENDLSEFYNIMDLCVPGVWGDLGLVKSTSKNKNRLLARKTVKPFILRRTKDQVLKELPEKIENHVYLDFSPEERETYQNKLNAVRSNMISTGAKRYGEVLKSLLEMRQLCLWQKQPTFQSTKIDFLMENLETLVGEGHKTLVFSQFTTYLDMIENKIKVNGWKMARIDGSQTIKKRGEQVEYFQNGEAQIFLISLKAGGFGLNLTAASYIFLMDPWWNPAVERQAIDRAHRIGQENKLTVYRPIIKESVEEKVLVLQQSKRELFRDLMAEDDDDYFSGKLNMDDFQHLLS
jgi:SNF2 family DNA or RNA helicase